MVTHTLVCLKEMILVMIEWWQKTYEFTNWYLMMYLEWLWDDVSFERWFYWCKWEINKLLMVILMWWVASHILLF